jgi:hypothetical protein
MDQEEARMLEALDLAVSLWHTAMLRVNAHGESAL